MTESRKITLMDGAMGTELRARGAPVADYKSSIWSALALMETPDMVRDVHEDYIRAGAEVITANNYAVTRKLLAREGAEDKLADLTKRATRLAREARDNISKDVLVAGSLPPLDTTYRIDLVDSYENNLTYYREMAGLLAPEVDIILCETLTTAQEARAAAIAGIEAGKPVWVSWTLAASGDTLRSGESLSQAISALQDLPIEAMLFNCSATEPVTRLMADLVRMAGRPTGAYCNPVPTEPDGGEPDWAAKNKMSAEEYAAIAAAWVDMGATIIGGCCDTSPEYIRQIKAVL